jgi:uncharacterized protein
MNTIIYILEFVFNAISSIGLFFIIGISIASIIKTFQLDRVLRKAFETNKRASIPIASGTGTFSPLCSCGVIPAVAALLASGVPLAPIMAFWITSPLMDPESFVLTYGLLGKEMAVARVLAALGIGLAAGYATLYFTNKGLLNNQVLKNFRKKSPANMDPEKDLSRLQIHVVRVIQFLINFKDLGLFVGKFILIAFVLEALMIKYVPMDWVGRALGSSNPYGPILAALIGVPAYASSISAMPIVRGLMDLGMDKGTALSFMIGGGATSIPAMVAVYSIVKVKTFVLYISFSMVGAIVAGYLFRLF